jgi:hypothetical protein
MGRAPATLVGDVQSVSGSTVSIRLRSGISSLALIDGTSYRIGQIGSFLRIPLGYTNLYGVCSQVGAAALPHAVVADAEIDGRWMTLSLFGESIGREFQRGVGQYPTFGDEVHLVTDRELSDIYGSAEVATPLVIGTIASTSGIEARLDLSRLVARHSAVVGSSGAGKSNLVAVVLEAIASQGFSSARVLVLDPHGEYASAVGANGRVFCATPKGNQEPLFVPYWALPFDELLQITLGDLNPANEAVIRTEVEGLRRRAAGSLPVPPPVESISADSPIPFSAKQLWADLIDFENRSYTDNACTTPTAQTPGDPVALKPNTYPAPAIGAGAPYKGPKRGIMRNLELMRNRLRDSRYEFLFSPGSELTPTLGGEIQGDLDDLVASWVGHDKPITVIDLSGTPADVLSLVTGTVLRIIYDALYWAADLPNGGRQQPLLIVLEEAHLFLPDGRDSAAQRTVAQVAKEGRKYGVGLMLVTQRPTELDSTALSQCGTMIALRLTNQADRARVGSTMPDDLANLTALLPSLRTGEAIITGEAMPIPSRVRLPEASNKPVGADPDLAAGWRAESRPAVSHYKTALSNWRALRDLAPDISTEQVDSEGDSSG